MKGELISNFFAVVLLQAATGLPSEIPQELTSKFEQYLSDPDSVHVRISSDKATAEGRLICGRFNAKNSYGGYVGYKDFIYRSSNRTLYFDGTAVREDDVDSLDEIMRQDPQSMAELDALSAQGDRLIEEVRVALALCTA